MLGEIISYENLITKKYKFTFNLGLIIMSDLHNSVTWTYKELHVLHQTLPAMGAKQKKYWYIYFIVFSVGIAAFQHKKYTGIVPYKMKQFHTTTNSSVIIWNVFFSNYQPIKGNLTKGIKSPHTL